MAFWNNKADSSDDGLLSNDALFEEQDLDESYNRHLYAALEQNKREGLSLAVKARWIALAITALLLVMALPSWEVIYYHLILSGLALIGWLQLRAGKVGKSRWELALIFFDILLMTVGMLLPNPFLDVDWPTAAQYSFENFKYFYVFLAAITLGYSWRTVLTYGTWTIGLWLIGMVIILFVGSSAPALTERLLAALKGDEVLLNLIDPSDIKLTTRIQEVAVFAIVTAILAVNSFRMNRLLLRQADTIRERANLARYFPPNMVEKMAGHDQPFGAVRSQNVAVMFVDIVGFTRLAEKNTPEDVIKILQDFHRFVEEAVFNHRGTLDKYLGDGVMASFGTPELGPNDATDSLRCAKALTSMLNLWNEERKARNEDHIRCSIGVHYGSVILGDIGTERRMEFAMVGDTVNVASRLEEMTRKLNRQCIISSDLVEAVKRETPNWEELLAPYSKQKGVQALRGRENGIEIWTCKAL
ncbi:MAG: adenylate/guanylate cyclase domain-containing protein [Rhizobiaceae bacterium]